MKLETRNWRVSTGTTIAAVVSLLWFEPLACAPARGEDAPVMNPATRLKRVETVKVWEAPGSNVSARQARFSPDGKWLAWSTSDGQLMVYSMEDKSTQTVWRADGGSVGDLTWSPLGALGACASVMDGSKKSGRMILWTPGHATSRLPMAEIPMNMAWRADGKAIAAGTLTGLHVLSVDKGGEEKILDSVDGWRPKGAAAYEDARFAGDAVVARIAGTMKWVLKRTGQDAVDLGECRAVIPDMPRNRLYLVPWVAGPAKIPRGAGLAWVDLADAKAERHSRVRGEPGQPYWLVDVADCEYPSTVRISEDGTRVTFTGVQAGVLSENAWREFSLWEVPADGSAAPRAVVKMGCIFKRMDVGRDYVIGWRPAMDPDAVLGDLARGRAWRLPKDVDVQRMNTDVLMDKLIIGAARGKEVVLMWLEE